jgi:PAS domain S-box-containing protein
MGSEIQASKFQNIRLSVFIPMIVAVLYLVIAVVVILVARGQVRASAVQEAEHQAELILQRNLAIHSYFAHALKPAVFELVGEDLPEDYFDSRWMSSTYAVREIDDLFQQNSIFSNYYYKEAAINARSPRNEADAIERQFIEDLNQDPELQEVCEIREINSIPFLVVMLRGEVMAESCLVCHSDPEAAPPGLVDVYGSERSFAREAGEVVSAISIRIPAATIEKEADALTLRLGGLLLAGFVLLYLLSSAHYQRLTFRPLAEIREKALAIARGEAPLGDQITTTAGRELADLATAFNTLSANLRAEQDRLEQRVVDRTAEIERQRQFFETLILSSPLAVAVLDMEFLVVACNPAFERMFGYTTDEVIGRQLKDLVIPQEELQDSVEAIERVLGGEILHQDGLRRYRKDGSVVNVELHGAPVSVEGEQIGVLIQYQDISTRQQAQNALLRAEKLSHMGTLAAGMAHEINSPLQIITGMSESLVRRLDSGKLEQAKLREELETIARNGWRVADVIRSLQTYIQPSPERLEPHHLNNIVSDTLRLTYPQFANARIELEIDLADDLPQLFCGRQLITQALINVLNNALEAMPDGGAVSVFTGYDTDEQLIVLGVADTGPGIPEAHLGRVFDPFFTTKPVGNGPGMGLAVAHGIVQAHGGRVRVESIVDQGTQVIMEFTTGAPPAGLPNILGLEYGRYNTGNNNN